ncbi:HAAS signaling domain-containing protein, partial [Streptomyces bambusae]|nr:hypothetical protein [Streptomyces bambusae]
MGIESDQLVYAYLSQVGDLAQRRQMPSGDRMRLVAGLRDEIDRRRARFEPETEASVRQILDRLGTPEQILDEHAALSARSASSAARHPAPAEPAAPSVPVQRGRNPLRKQPPPVPPQRSGGAPPHMAGLDELGPADGGPEPDWWRVSKSPYGSARPRIEVEGFAGGIEYPEFRPPEADRDEDEDGDGAAAKGADGSGSGSGTRAGSGASDPSKPKPAAAAARTLVRALRKRRAE